MRLRPCRSGRLGLRSVDARVQGLTRTIPRRQCHTGWVQVFKAAFSQYGEELEVEMELWTVVVHPW